MFITNAFSLQMVNGNYSAEIKKVSHQYMILVKNNLVSAIGHADTAAVVSAELGVDYPQNRVNITLELGDELIVAQLMGGRLPEGATSLPKGFEIVYKRVVIAEIITPTPPIKIDLPLGKHCQLRWLIITPAGAELWEKNTGGRRNYTPRKTDVIALDDLADFLAKSSRANCCC